MEEQSKNIGAGSKGKNKSGRLLAGPKIAKVKMPTQELKKEYLMMKMKQQSEDDQSKEREMTVQNSWLRCRNRV